MKKYNSERIFEIIKVVDFDKPELELGMPEDVKTLMYLGIDLETLDTTREDTKGYAQIGFNPKEQKWYGWSHRGIFGFGIGDIVKEGDVCNTHGWTDDYIQEHPEKDISLPVGFAALTIEDAKKMAIAYAKAIS